MSTLSAEARAQALYAEAHEVPVRAVDIELLEDLEVPGLLVFRGYHSVGDGVPPHWAAGVHDGTATVWGPDATAARVVAAYRSAGRPLPQAADLARVLGFLEVRHEETDPLIEPDDWQDMREDWAARITAPAMTTVDGHPALVYWNTSAEPPLWRTTWVFDPAGARRTTESIWDM